MRYKPVYVKSWSTGSDSDDRIEFVETDIGSFDSGDDTMERPGFQTLPIKPPPPPEPPAPIDETVPDHPDDFVFDF